VTTPTGRLEDLLRDAAHGRAVQVGDAAGRERRHSVMGRVGSFSEPGDAGHHASATDADEDAGRLILFSFFGHRHPLTPVEACVMSDLRLSRTRRTPTASKSWRSGAEEDRVLPVGHRERLAQPPYRY